MSEKTRRRLDAIERQLRPAAMLPVIVVAVEGGGPVTILPLNGPELHFDTMEDAEAWLADRAAGRVP